MTLADDEQDDFRFGQMKGKEAREAFDAAAKRLQRPERREVQPSVGPHVGIPTDSMSPLKRWFLGQIGYPRT